MCILGATTVNVGAIVQKIWTVRCTFALIPYGVHGRTYSSLVLVDFINNLFETIY